MENQNYTRFENQEVISLKEWIITLLIMVIPIVNIVMLFVWAFSDNTPKSKSNWAKAKLVIMLLSFLLTIVLLILFWGAIAALIVGAASTGNLN